MLKYEECYMCEESFDEDDMNDSEGGRVCDSCIKTIKRKRHRITLQDCKQHAISMGGKCLATSYKNASVKMKWECACGFTWMAKYNHIKHSGSWCPKCEKKARHTLAFCQDFAIQKNGVCVSTSYTNIHDSMKWRCNECNKEFSNCFNNIHHNNEWCPYCAGKATLTIEECHALAKERGGECLSTTYRNGTTKMKWKCGRCSHIWEAAFSPIKFGSWCPNCAGRPKLSLADCQKVAESKNGICVSKEYVNNATLMKWKCNVCDNTWKATFRHIKLDTWCPYCLYKSESAAKKIMEEIMGVLFTKCRPPWLKGLELDGYNKQLKMAFEYNGSQHYTETELFHSEDGDFDRQLERDKCKIRRCLREGIALIIIPYTYTHNDIDAMYAFIDEEIDFQLYIQKRNRMLIDNTTHLEIENTIV